MPPRNFSEGLVSERTLRFHMASAASNNPGRSPTRGSGVGGIWERLAVGPTDVVGVTLEVAHPAAANTITPSAIGPADVRSVRERRGTRGLKLICVVPL